jgi:D-3-phosphoglycerate dehydrogenase / 2-oxoglutarate reductase
VAAREKVVYIDGAVGDGVIEREVLAARGYELELAGCTSDDEVVAVAGRARAILNSYYWMGPDLFERLPELKVVVRGGVGYDNIDVQAATKTGVVVCNVIDYCTHEVANHAFAMLLALNRKVLPLDRALRERNFKHPAVLMPHTGRLAGQTLGLVSFGAIARAVAKRAQGFDMRVIAFDPYADAGQASALGVELVELPELLARSDYVSVHTPLSEATRGMIGAVELALMKPSSYLVLTSRGGVLDETALASALSDKQIAGAGLDVWEQEPPAPGHPLFELDNVLVSMHMAWYSEVGDIARRQGHAESAADFLDGIAPRSVVNPEVLERVNLKPRPAA